MEFVKFHSLLEILCHSIRMTVSVVGVGMDMQFYKLNV